MPRRQYTVQDLVDGVRSLLDESNTDSIDDTADILPSLNRGLDYAGSSLAKRYPDPFLRTSDTTLVAGDDSYAIPEDCFEDRILKVEFKQNGNYTELRRVSYYDLGKFQSTSNGTPTVYAIVGRDMLIAPAPATTDSLRLWYFRQPEELVLPQGRITALNSASNYVTLDEAGTALSTESDTLESYVNIVDCQTGAIKWTGQIQILSGTRLTFRGTPVRTTVLNRTVSDALSDSTEIGLDDYVCNIRGTCIPEFSQPLANFLIEYAVAEMTRKVGGDAPTEERILDKFEKQVTGTWSGRENTTRIKRRFRNASASSRRWPITQR